MLAEQRRFPAADSTRLRPWTTHGIASSLTPPAAFVLQKRDSATT